jgi:cytochrome P450
MFCIYLLAMYPSVQETLFAELQSVCGSGSDNNPSLSNIPDLIYTTCILYETMRLFPLVAFLGQRVTKDQTLHKHFIPPQTDQVQDQLVQGKYFIPGGTAIALDLSNTERNPRFWDNPNEFIPSRFDARYNPLSEYVEGKFKFPVKGAFIGFGDGPRACLGASPPQASAPKRSVFERVNCREEIC